MLHTTIVNAAVIGIVGYIVGRQLLGEPLRGRRVVVLPAVLTLIGWLDLVRGLHHGHALRAPDVMFLVVAALVAVGIGLAQGAVLRLEHRGEGLWGQLPVRGLWLWAALVASRLLVDVAASASGATVVASSSSILFVLGINRLAQAGVITLRAARAGIRFAPEQAHSGIRSLRGTLTRDSRSGAAADAGRRPTDDLATPIATHAGRQLIPDRPEGREHRGRDRGREQRRAARARRGR